MYASFCKYVILYLIRRFVSELIEYACVNTRKSRASIREQKSRNAMHVVRRFNHRRK